jgi:aspartyl-tRNA(Asn)/glutamyl-tRNA(Gln) amidotransferase subunit B
VIARTKHRKAAANMVMGPVRSWINERGLPMADFPVSAVRMAGLVELVEAGTVSNTQATQKLFPLLLTKEGTAEELAREHDLVQVKNDDLVERLVREAMERYPEKVAAYRSGQKGLLGLFMGEVMKGTKGKADPKAASDVVKRILEG